MTTISRREDLVPRTAPYYRLDPLLVRAAILGVIFFLTIRDVHYLRYAVRAIAFPFELNYAEGIVWQQALLIPGPRMYGDITQFPFIVFEYPPIYHLLVRAIANFGIDPLAAGRGVTLAATLMIAILAGAIAFAAMREIASIRARVIGAAVAGLMVLTYYPVQKWAVTMRVDLLATCFSIAGVYLAIVAGQRAIILYAAILVFVLAVYTKQTELSAPIAPILVLTAVNIRLVLRAIGFGLCIAIVGFITLQLNTDGGFWRHIVEYNGHSRFWFSLISDSLYNEKRSAVGLLAGLMAFAFLWWSEAKSHHARSFTGWIHHIRGSIRLRALSILSLWFIFASAQLVTLGRWGADSNYLIEWMCVTAVPIGMLACVAWVSPAIGDRSVRVTAVAGVLLSIAVVAHASYRPISKHAIVDDPTAMAPRNYLMELIRKNGKPTLSEDMVLLLRAGQQVPIEPAIFAELAAAGIWDQRALLNLIRDHAFSLIIRTEEVDSTAQFTNEETKAIRDSYPLIEYVGNYIVRYPRVPEHNQNFYH